MKTSPSEFRVRQQDLEGEEKRRIKIGAWWIKLQSRLANCEGEPQEQVMGASHGSRRGYESKEHPGGQNTTRKGAEAHLQRCRNPC